MDDYAGVFCPTCSCEMVQIAHGIMRCPSCNHELQDMEQAGDQYDQDDPYYA